MTTVILLDGGMGQELIKRAQAPITPLWSAQVMQDHPDLVEDLHLEFIEAGAKVITLNTYTATSGRLARDADIAFLNPIHESAIKAAHNAVNRSGKQNIRVAGCLPPLMASYLSAEAPDYLTSLDHYQSLVDLQQHDVDLFICETMSNIAETKAAATAAKSTAKETWVSFVLNERTKKLPSGEQIERAVFELEALDVDAILINCCSPETINQALPTLTKLHDNIGAYANAFENTDALTAGGTVECLNERQDILPKSYAEQSLQWINQGAKIIGGCCAIGPEHIKTLHDRLIAEGIEIKSTI